MPTRSRTETRVLVAAAISLAVAITAASWYRHVTYRSSTFDLAVFDQAIWLMSRFHTPRVSTIGWNVFADHLSPVLFVFVPLYWLKATVLWLFAAQGVALGAGLLAFDRLLLTVTIPPKWRVAFLAAYVVNPLLWNAAMFDFHPTTLAVPLLLVAVTAALQDDVRVFAIAALGTLLLRDDLGLAIAAAGLVGFAASRRRITRLALVAGPLAWAVLGNRIGRWLGSDRHWRFHYGYLGSSTLDALTHPWHSLPELARGMWREDNLLLIVIWLFSLALLPLLRPARAALAGVIGVPLFASALQHFHSAKFHYGAPVFPLLAVAAVTGIERLQRSFRRVPGELLLIAAGVLTFVLAGPPATQVWTQPAPPRSVADASLRLVKPDDAVTGSNAMAPHLAHRRVLLPFPYPFARRPLKFPLNGRVKSVSAAKAATIDVVIIYVQPGREEQATARGFFASPYLTSLRLVYHRAGVRVYRRPGR
jgi:uncharacterized membrane protein